MKAMRIHQHGGPEVLKLEQVDPPRPKPGEVIVGVKACAMNHLDLWTRNGLPGRQIPMPHILGSDIAGVVEEVGERFVRHQGNVRHLYLNGRFLLC